MAVVPILPAASITRTSAVLLLLSVRAPIDQLLPAAVAVSQLTPLSSDTLTTSPTPSAPSSVPWISVWPACLVTRSVAELPVSSESVSVAPVMVGAVVSITRLRLAPSEPAVPGVSSITEATRPAPLLS